MSAMRKRPNLTEGQFDKQVAELRKWIRESVSPFERDTPAKQKARKERGRTDRLYVFATYLPHYFSVEFADCHKEWQEITELEDQLALVGAPREMAKSTFFSLGNHVHKTVYALHHFQFICSDTHEQAGAFTLQIKLELDENPRIKHDFGALKTKNWSDDEFETTNGVKIMARGRKDKVRGIRYRQYRPTLVTFDDMENDETVENPDTTKKIKNWIRGAVLGSLGKGYSAIMVGNLFSPLSAISQLIADVDDEGLPRYVSKVYDLILDEGTPNERSLWPAAWPMDRIRKKKHDVGTYTFNKEYRNRVGVDDSPFPEEQAAYFERIEVISRPLIFCTAVDPSGTAKSGSDFRAVITFGLDTERMVFPCMHAWIKRRSIGEMFAAAYAQHDEYPGPVVVEENMFKDFLHEAIKNYAKDVQRFLPWAPVQHSSNKIARIVGTCGILWEYGRILFMKNHSDQAILREQFTYIFVPTVHDDGPDAAEMSISKLQSGLVKAAGAGSEPETRDYHAERPRGLMTRLFRRAA
ncbi:MAG: hypothetical protein LLG97_19600 [Deltaproteobacteria bacterium]|nr:hypothetical protein [Deltaproteobacteria bacterium]